jgi:Zn-dependent protease/CBS domain-containing protein
VFRHTIPIGRIFGITIDLDYTWFLIIGLLTWILAASYYPVEFPNWSTGEYWVIGLLTSLLLFASVLLHELGHSIVAMRYGTPVPRITLFIFGGVSQMSEEPSNAGAEFWIAIAGPLVSFALAALFWEIEPLFTSIPPLFALTRYLALLNFILGVFNLIPGFPLDGGRVFRAILWRATGKLHRATMIAGVTGRFFGFFLIFLGVWMALTGNFFNGLWIAFIGWFLDSAAGSQMQQELVKNLLGRHTVAEAMKREFPQVSGGLTLQELVDRQILAGGLRAFVVNSGNGSTGLVTLSGIRAVPRSEWANTNVSQVMVPLEKLHTIRPDAELWTAFEKMGRDGVNQLPVIERSGIVGMLSRDDLLHYLRVLQALAH